MLRPKDMLLISHHLHVAAMYYEMAADEIIPKDLHIATEQLGKAIAIIKSKEERWELGASTEKPNDDEGRLGGEDMERRREGVPSLPAASRGAA